MTEGILVGRKFVGKKLYILYFKTVCKAKRGWHTVTLISTKCTNISIAVHVHCRSCSIFS